jgi:hypothetical protein
LFFLHIMKPPEVNDDSGLSVGVAPEISEWIVSCNIKGRVERRIVGWNIDGLVVRVSARGGCCSGMDSSSAAVVVVLVVGSV